jgi:hypothetical protein
MVPVGIDGLTVHLNYQPGPVSCWFSSSALESVEEEERHSRPISVVSAKLIVRPTKLGLVHKDRMFMHLCLQCQRIGGVCAH